MLMQLIPLLMQQLLHMDVVSFLTKGKCKGKVRVGLLMDLLINFEWTHLHIHLSLTLVCHRCLQPLRRRKWRILLEGVDDADDSQPGDSQLTLQEILADSKRALSQEEEEEEVNEANALTLEARVEECRCLVVDGTHPQLLEKFKRDVCCDR